VSGFIANPFDVPAFAERVERLLADPELRARMGAAGKKRLEAHFTIERLTAEFLEEYTLAKAAAELRAVRLASGPAARR
jgi:glycosyltransferase involved in cell wall biosynthesis